MLAIYSSWLHAVTPVCQTVENETAGLETQTLTYSNS